MVLAGFNGKWKDTSGLLITIDGVAMSIRDGCLVRLDITGAKTCRFEALGETYHGVLCGVDRLAWSDGSLWMRLEPLFSDSPPTPIATALVAAASAMDGYWKDREGEIIKIEGSKMSVRNGEVLNVSFPRLLECCIDCSDTGLISVGKFTLKADQIDWDDGISWCRVQGDSFRVSPEFVVAAEKQQSSAMSEASCWLDGSHRKSDAEPSLKTYEADAESVFDSTSNSSQPRDPQRSNVTYATKVETEKDLQYLQHALRQDGLQRMRFAAECSPQEMKKVPEEWWARAKAKQEIRKRAQRKYLAQKEELCAKIHGVKPPLNSHQPSQLQHITQRAEIVIPQPQARGASSSQSRRGPTLYAIHSDSEDDDNENFRSPSYEQLCFDGKWEDDDGSRITIRDTKLEDDDGNIAYVDLLDDGRIAFRDENESASGHLCEDRSRIVWDDGTFWIRVIDEKLVEHSSSKEVSVRDASKSQDREVVTKQLLTDPQAAPVGSADLSTDLSDSVSDPAQASSSSSSSCVSLSMDTNARQAAMPLKPGLRVRFKGMQLRPELNGYIGRLVRKCEKRGRWQVRIEIESSSRVLAKDTNLEPLDQQAQLHIPARPIKVNQVRSDFEPGLRARLRRMEAPSVYASQPQFNGCTGWLLKKDEQNVKAQARWASSKRLSKGEVFEPLRSPPKSSWTKPEVECEQEIKAQLIPNHSEEKQCSFADAHSVPSEPLLPQVMINSEVHCEAGHLLKPCFESEDAFVCDVCGKFMLPPLKIQYCQHCDYCMCPECFSHASLQ